MKKIKKKVMRKLNKVGIGVLKFIVAICAIVFICTILLWVYFIGMSLFFKYDKDSIKRYKDNAYKIYNEGICSQIYYWDSIEIESPDGKDKLNILESGIKSLNYPDLMKIVLKNNWGYSIEFSNSEFKIKKLFHYRDLKITVDKEHSRDITYYVYTQKMDWKRICKEFLALCIIVFLLFNFSGGLLILIDELKKKNI